MIQLVAWKCDICTHQLMHMRLKRVKCHSDKEALILQCFLHAGSNATLTIKRNKENAQQQEEVNL